MAFFTAAKKNEAFCGHCYESLQDILSEKAKHRAVCIAHDCFGYYMHTYSHFICGIVWNVSVRTHKKLVHGCLQGEEFNFVPFITSRLCTEYKYNLFLNFNLNSKIKKKEERAP